MSDQSSPLLEQEVERALADIMDLSKPLEAPRAPAAFTPSEASSYVRPESPAAAPPPAAPSATVRPLAVAARGEHLPRRSLDDEVGRFLDTANRMLQKIRDQIADAESAFVLDRAKLADQYRRRIVELENEAADALLKLEGDHREALAKKKRMLDALTAMRGE